MRFVDLPASPTRTATSPVSSRRAPTVSPLRAPPAVSSVPLRVEPPVRTVRRSSGLRRMLKKAWADLRWSLSTMRFRRERALLLSRARAVQAAPLPSPEPVYVIFGA